MSWNPSTYRVAAFDQMQAGKTLETPALKSLEPGVNASHGVCDMLSAKWVRMMIKGKVTSASERMKHLNTAETMKKAILRHTLEDQDRTQGLGSTTTIPKNRGQLLECLVRSKLSLHRLPGTGKPIRTALHTVIDGYGLKLIGGNMPSFLKPATEQVAKEVSGSWGVCSLIAINREMKEAHAIACRGGAFFVEFFDPNFGEYLIPTLAFKGWLTGLVIDHYKADNNISVGQFENNITDPGQRSIQWHVGTCNWMATLQAIDLLRSRGPDTLNAPGAMQQLSRADIETLVNMFSHGKRWSKEETMTLMQALSQSEQDCWQRSMNRRRVMQPISED